jgi:hypothetical protein
MRIAFLLHCTDGLGDTRSKWMRTFTQYPLLRGNLFEASRLWYIRNWGSFEFVDSSRLKSIPWSSILILVGCARSYKRSDNGTRLVVGFDLPDLSTVGIRSSSGI